MGWKQVSGKKGNLRRGGRHLRREIAVIEQLESRRLLSADMWTGLGDGTTWSNAANWQNGVPQTGDDVTINTSGSTTINFTSAAGNVTLDSLTSNTPLTLSGGSLTITGSVASTVSANFSMTGGALSVTGSGGFTESGSGTISNANLAASGGGILALSGITGLINVNLTAGTTGSGASTGQILFPAMTTYASSANTIQANGSGSKIDLSAMTSFTNNNGYWSSITPSTGAVIDLAGQISGGLNLTLPDAASTLNVAAVTKLSNLDVSATAGTLNFSDPNLTTLTNVNLTATSGGQILFPAVATYASSANTIQASGNNSKIDLSALAIFTNNNGYWSSITPSTGAEIDLAGQLDGGLNLTLSGIDSVLSIANISSLTNVTLSATNGATFVLPAGWDPTWGSGDTFTTSGTGSQFVNKADITLSGQTLNITASAFSNQGVLDAVSGGTFNISNSFSVDGSGALIGLSGGQFNISGNLLGSTQNAEKFAPLATINFDGTDTSQTPQLLEAMSQDAGAVGAGFSNNFNYFGITLGNHAYVKLVDQFANSDSGKPEAVYVGSLIVPQGATLDLSGLHVYCYDLQNNGQTINGTITQLPVGGSIALNSPTPVDLKTAGELDQWSFFDRGGESVAIVVNPGTSGSPAAISPPLDWANVELLDSNNNVLIPATPDTSAGGIIELTYTIPANGDGVYNIDINAPAGDTNSAGNYVVTVYDATTTTNPLVLGNTSNGALVSGYDINDWTFTATANEVVNFHVLSRTDPNLVFDLIDPSGASVFTKQGSSLLNVTLPAITGTYTVKAYSLDAQAGSYSFELDQATPTTLTLGQSYSGTFAGNGESELFQVAVPTSQALKFTLTNSDSGDFTDLYAEYNAIPSQGTYDYASTGGGATQVLLAPQATSGEWYVLVYANFLASSTGTFTLEADSKEAFVTSVSPGTATSNTQTTLTIGGAGFIPGSTVSLVGTSGTYVDTTPIVDLPTKMTAQFAANRVPAGTYSVLITQPDGATDTLANALVMSSSGQTNLLTKLVAPTILGYAYDATIYVDYTNTGSAAMPAPILLLTATQGSNQGAIMTLNPELQNNGLSVSSEPAGYSSSIQILASGATPGLLEPGDSEQIPVYYAGWLKDEQDPNDGPITFSLSVLEADATTAVDYATVLPTLKPAGISATAWNLISATLESELGGTAGGYVQLLDQEASYLGTLGENVTDAQSLWGFAVQQANNSLGVTGTLSTGSGNVAGAFSPLLTSATDDSVSTTDDFSLDFTRSYAQSISSRDTMSTLGMGWTTPWQTTATPTKVDGTVTAVTINESNGAQRIFAVDTINDGSFFSEPGDTGTLTINESGNYLLTESNGTETEYDLATGHVNYEQDSEGNRITAAYNTNGQLISLTSSSGAFIHIAYNSANLISSITDSNGLSTTYNYDPTNAYLMSVTNSNGQTTEYTYNTTSGSFSQNALTAITFPDGAQETFGYDTQGRLSSISGSAEAAPMTISYNPNGTTTSANLMGQIGIAIGTNNAPSYYYYNENGLVGKSIDTSGTPTYYINPDSIPSIGETPGVIGNLALPIPGTPQILNGSTVTVVASHDPNDMEGPIGYDPSTSNWFADTAPLPYTINFENASNETGIADAAAQTVKVTDPIDPALDINSINEVTVIIDPPGGATAIVKTVYIDRIMKVTLSYPGYPELVLSIYPYIFQGAVVVEFETIVSNNGVSPTNSYVGWLLANESASVSYNILPMPGLPTPTPITNVGSITFDQNTPVLTDQVDDSNLAAGTNPTLDAAVTIDSSPPAVNQLIAPISGTTINLSWNGSDAGSGVDTYDLFVSIDGGSPTLVTQTTTDPTPANPYPYMGSPGHTYTFYVVPADNVDNIGPSSPQVIVPLPVIAAAPPTPVLTPVSSPSAGDSTVQFTVTYNDNVSLSASTLGSGNIVVSDPNGPTLQAALVSQSSVSGGIAAVYSITAPNGTFSAADNGLYTVVVGSNPVENVDGQPASGTVGQFPVAISDSTADTTPPTATVASVGTPTIDTTTLSFVVDFSDNVSLNTSSIATGDITVTGPDEFSQVATLISGPTSSSATAASATFQITAPGGFFTQNATGKYTISLNANSLFDTAGNTAAGGNIGSFPANIPAPPALPDLSGSIATIPTSVVPLSKKNTVVINVSNSGAKAIKANVPFKLYAFTGNTFSAGSATLLSSGTLKVSLNTSGSKEFSESFAAPTSIATGDYHIVAVLDPDNTIAEQYKSNNTLISSGTAHFAAPTVDLGITLPVTPSSISTEKKRKIAVNVTNHGNVTANGTGTIQIYASSDENDLQTLIGTLPGKFSLKVGAGKKYSVAISNDAALKGDQEYLIAVVSYSGSPGDSNLANNTIFSNSMVVFM